MVNLGGGVFRVEGGKVERIVLQTEWDNDEAIAYLQHRLERMGVEKALDAAGARTGDEVRILGRAFSYLSAKWDGDDEEREPVVYEVRPEDFDGDDMLD